MVIHTTATVVYYTFTIALTPYCIVHEKDTAEQDQEHSNVSQTGEGRSF